jgi:D-beta-D-heptose 7-phosphate kinase/D-beta-D-heptose 1-phosphate adenosyltransferase
MTDAPDRVLSRPDLLQRFGRPRTGRLVLSNGVFDILHRGHVASLEAARALGDHLVVAVNSDVSTRRLKGEGRPLQPQADRAYLLASLRCVDAVTIFDEDTPQALIEALLPDVLVKGADYEGRPVAGADAVIAAGGELRLIQLEPGRSTTGILDRISDFE